MCWSYFALFAAGLLLGCPGCRDESSSMLTGNAGQHGLVPPQRESSSPTPESTGIDPRSERDIERAAAWEEAISGLDFSTGVVRVKAPPRASNAAEAQRMMATAEEMYQQVHKTRAVKHYALAIQAAPDLIEPYLGLGKALTLRGKTDMAIASYRTVLQRDPNHVEARMELAHATARLGEFEAAIEEMNRVLEQEPTNGNAHERLAVWNYYVERFEQSWSHVEAAKRAGQPVPPQFLNLLRDRMPEPAVG